MKCSFRILLFCTFLTFICSHFIIAQKVEKLSNKDARETKINSINSLNSVEAVGDSVSIKSSSKLLMTVTEETSAGSIKLKDAGTVSSKTNKLYNNSGNLYWGNDQLGLASSGVSELNDLIDVQYDLSSLYIGENAGGTNDDGGNLNTAVGKNALGSSETGSRNTATGYSALESNTTGFRNTATGYSALESNTTGNYNIGIGNFSNYLNQTGSKNTIVGFQAGRGTSLHSKSGNVFLGYQVGYFETGNDKLYIDNSSTTSPLIWGDFSSAKVTINGQLGVGSTIPSFKLHVVDNSGGTEVAMFHNTVKSTDSDGIIIKAGIDVNPGNGVDYLIFQDGDAGTIGVVDGDGAGGVNYGSSSDRRLKTKIRNYKGALQTISKIQVRLYERKATPGIDEVGFIAQEIQKVYPQIVSGSPENNVETNPMMVDYGKITPLLVGAIQEQKSSIKMQDKRIKKLEKENEELKKIVIKNASLENKVSQLEHVINKILSKQLQTKISLK